MHSFLRFNQQQVSSQFDIYYQRIRSVAFIILADNLQRAGTHLGPFLIWAPDSFGPHSFGPLTHLGPNTFGPQLIWAPTHLGPDSFGPQHIWAPTHLGPDSFGPRLIWAPTHLGPDSFLSPKKIFKFWKFNFKISKSRFSISHKGIIDKKGCFFNVVCR